MQIDSFPVKRLAIFILTIALCFALWYFSTIVIYIVVSLILSLLGRPIQELLMKIRIKNWRPGKTLVAAITLIILFIVIGGFFYALTPVLIGQLAKVSSTADIEVGNILQFPLNDFQNAINSRIPNADISFKNIITEELKPFFSLDLVKDVVGVLAKTTMDIIVGVFCVLFITFFFLQDQNMFTRWIMYLVPEKYESNMLRAFESIYKLQMRYLVGITAESLAKCLFLWFFFWLFGLYWDAALSASLICSLLNFVPYVGPIIGGALAMLIGLVSAPIDVSVYQLEISMFAVLVIFQVIDNILLQPYIYANSVKAHPLEIFIVILMAGYMGGIVGMILAIPTYTILRVLAKEFLSRFKIVRDLTIKL